MWPTVYIIFVAIVAMTALTFGPSWIDQIRQSSSPVQSFPMLPRTPHEMDKTNSSHDQSIDTSRSPLV